MKMACSIREPQSSTLTLISNSRFFQVTLSPILALAIYLHPISPTIAQDSPQSQISRSISSGNQISLNGRVLSGFWVRELGTGGRVTTLISDGALQLIGVDLLNSSNPAKQPVQWFSSTTAPLVLNTKLLAGYRYLDITNFAQIAGWQMQVLDKKLVISTPQAKVTNIVFSKQPGGEALVINLDRPTFWQVTSQLPVSFQAKSVSHLAITVDGIADSTLIQRYTPPPSTEPFFVELVNNQTIIHLSIPLSQSVQISTLNNPSRLMIKLGNDTVRERDITWASGLYWRQRWLNLGTDRFPIVWLEINPSSSVLKLKPIWTNPQTLVGTAPLIQTAQRYLATAAINGGYFNRNNGFPLGAIRRDSQWVSGPILNRGAIAWNDAGEFYFERLTLTETLMTANNQKFPILLVNSGYVQSGIARYTSIWGPTYTPVTDNEILLIVQKGKITNQLAGGKAGTTPVNIPQDGYLLTVRGNAASIASQLPIGTVVNITSTTTPAKFSQYPYIVGAGPLLVKNGQIVLDAKSEKFSDAFIAEKAIRSGVCTTTTGKLIIAAIHNRAGGPGPTLAEHAKLMQAIGCVDALNLDGGSSTSLYLGGQLVNRPPSTAARVHNGIGIFMTPK